MESSTFLSQKSLQVFELANFEYHRHDSVDYPEENPFDVHSFQHLLYKKNWIDNVQWHLEDAIRSPGIDADVALKLKRRIDLRNQERTDVVEAIDTYFAAKYQSVVPSVDAYCNTESPAWALDRLSILVLRLYHMRIEFERAAEARQRAKCEMKLNVLLQQKEDLCRAIDRLIINIESGNIAMRVYRQMKMYNDPTLNPALYAKS